MSTWKAECWLGSNAGRQTLEVQASTYTGAKEQLERVYGATQITNLRKVESSSGSSLSSSDIGGLLWLGAIGFVLYFLITYWYIVVPISLIIFIITVIGMRK